MNDPKKIRINEGWTPMEKGHLPKKVQGGYVPTASRGAVNPPSGGSAVKPPPKK
ncbi:MAG: hypothetical protein JO013_11320 [Alphaproteobacteria bacterium]|nr:hypothetical protein [Alphaproteobacteria bacterium]